MSFDAATCFSNFHQEHIDLHQAWETLIQLLFYTHSLSNTQNVKRMLPTLIPFLRRAPADA